ncbi:MAG TPA: type I restriction enzyme HsdR N-terminal domain-containing protein [Bacteroidia bacterium]|nr:type I restriction enzyme HsdR N-terminal domain-containing protein [Bacteroidia bacterium]
MKTYWQVASGSKQRSYPNVFIDFGVFAVNEADKGRGGYHNYLRQAKKGDIFILKEGLKLIHAVGIVKDDELRKQEFYFNFDGWELDYFKYVEWFAPVKPIKVVGLKQGTINQCHKEHLKKIADDGLKKWKQAKVKYKIDKNIQIVKDEDIINSMINNGLKISQSEILTSTLNQVRRLANYYTNNFEPSLVNEDQVRSLIVIPFLLAIGWSEQQVLLEYHIGKQKADIICFDRPSHEEKKKAKLLVEVKKLSEGLTYGVDQAFSYAKELKDVRIICVTNGFCYQIYDLNSDNPKEPYAYINILKPINKYPLSPKTKGAVEALMKIIPSN